jgi:predicted nucleic-acid-binding protein
MIAVDTNVIVRYITRDEPEQERKARALFLNNPVYVSLTVLLETEWVLRHTYRLERSTIAKAIETLLGIAQVEVEQPHSVLLALEGFRAGLDFADAIHVAACPAPAFATFDADLKRLAAKIFPAPEVITP